MAPSKKPSKILETARHRLAGLKSIQPEPRFNPTVTVADYELKVNSVAAQIDSYHQLLAELDLRISNIKSEEAELNDLSRRWLSAIQAIYGPDSSEYEMVGGTRKRRRY
jgi:hypothetical protein